MKMKIFILIAFLFYAGVANGAHPAVPIEKAHLKKIRIVTGVVTQPLGVSETVLNITARQSGTHFYLKNPGGSLADFSINLPSDPENGTWFKFTALSDFWIPSRVAFNSAIWRINTIYHDIVVSERDMGADIYTVPVPYVVYQGVKWAGYKKGDSAEFMFVDGKWRVDAKTGMGAMVFEKITRE